MPSEPATTTLRTVTLMKLEEWSSSRASHHNPMSTQAETEIPLFSHSRGRNTEMEKGHLDSANSYSLATKGFSAAFMGLPGAIGSSPKPKTLSPPQSVATVPK
ncbi:predicted protein [Botrytis cinerea T4]|uniref:Uncharacterized protein n=1 Tax=Botryotinia fuckeliana (strain T4) TaxID=999810 RepID=G2XTY6_BOTF4|nr:predicted protein [Botrytis cinerea T4]